MWELLEPKMWASHLLRDKAAASIAQGFPGGAIDAYRQVGMNECEITLGTSFAAASLRDKLWEIDERQKQARRRIASNRKVQARMVTETLFYSGISRRLIAQQVHEDEGIIMGLERLWFIMSGSSSPYRYEDAIDVPVRAIH